jgi:hypothetical protein
MTTSFFKYQSPIPVSRNTSIGEAILSTLEPNGSQIGVIKLPSYLNLDQNTLLRVKPIGQVLYLESEESFAKSQALEIFLVEQFPYYLESVQYSLRYNWIVEMYHLMSLDHIKSTHWFTLNGFSVIQLKEYKETELHSELTYEVRLPNSLDAFRLKSDSPRTSVVTLTLFSAFTVGMKLRIRKDWNFLILFNVLPTSDNSHKLFVDFYSTKEIRFRFLTKQLIKIAALLTVFEDFEYLNFISRRNLNKLKVPEISGVIQNNSLIKRFYTLYSKYF